jgi:DNA polymerase-4
VHYQHANGFGTDELDYSHNLPKSIGSSETFLRDTNDFVEIKDKLVELTNDVVRRLKYHEQKAKTISVNIKTIDFKTRNKSFTMRDYTDDLDKIVVTATNLYQEYFANTTIRLVGISVSNLIESSELFINSELFDDYMKQPKLEIKQIDENSIISGINQKFSKNILGIAKDKLK